MERLRSLVAWLSPCGKADSQLPVQPFSIKNAVLEGVGSGNWMAEPGDNDVGLLPTPLCWWLASVTLVALQGGSDPPSSTLQTAAPITGVVISTIANCQTYSALTKLYSCLVRGLRRVRVVGRMGSTLQVGSGQFWGICIATVCCHAPHFSVNELLQSLRLSVCSLPLQQFLKTLVNAQKG